MQQDQESQNIYLTTGIISAALGFMLITGYYIIENTENSSSSDMAVDQRIDQCYEEKGLD